MIKKISLFPITYLSYLILILLIYIIVFSISVSGYHYFKHFNTIRVERWDYLDEATTQIPFIINIMEMMSDCQTNTQVEMIHLIIYSEMKNEIVNLIYHINRTMAHIHSRSRPPVRTSDYMERLHLISWTPPKNPFKSLANADTNTRSHY